MYREVRVSRVVPGVPLAGCVLRPGRAINCEPLSGARVARGGARNPLLLPLYPACIFNACVPLPLSSNSVSLAVSLFSGHRLRTATEPLSTHLSRFNFRASNHDGANVRVRSHARDHAG